jgi:hypothetical protein
MQFQLLKTCYACPEQYDVSLNGKDVAYLRLRHGRFYAAVPDVGGKVVYEANPNGDGSFDDDERDKHLTAACVAIARDLGCYADLTFPPYTIKDAAE